MLNHDLETLGLTKNEIKVYLALLPLGQAKAGQIIKNTGMHRNLVYMALDSLQQRKLLTKQQIRGVTVYKSTDPAYLLDEIMMKETLARNAIKELKARSKPLPSQEIVIHEGKEALQNYFFDRDRRTAVGTTTYIIGSTGDLWYDLMGDRLESYEKQRVKKRITVSMIAFTYSKKEQQHARGKFVRVKIIPRAYQPLANIQVMEDRVALISFTEPYAVVEVKNAALAQSYRQYFQILWETNVLTLRGAAGARFFLEDTLKERDVYWIGGNGGVEKFHPEVWREHAPKRVQKQVFWHDLVDPKSKLSTINNFGKSIGKFSELKELPEVVSSPHVICIYGNKVANIVWKKNSVINIIEDKDLAEGYLKYFHYLWNQEVRTYTGWKEIEHLYCKELMAQQKAGDKEYVMTAGFGERGTISEKKVAKFFIKYNTLRTQLGTHKQILFFGKDRQRAYDEFSKAGDPDFKLVELRFLPDEFYSPMQVALIAGKAVVVIFSEEPVATVYERPGIVASFKKQFDLLWSIGKP